MNPTLAAIMAQIGFEYMGVSNPDFQAANIALQHRNNGIACDAQPALVTTSNSGIPAFLSTFIDPNLIEVLVAPMRATEIVGSEVRKGDWTTKTAMFPVVESTGQTSAYGDYNENGVANANVNFPQRQSFHYQVFTQWGELELANAGLAKVDWANQQNIASVLALNKYQNKSYFYGVAGLQNYGLLNDPSLYSPIVPNTKAATGTSWANATADEIIADFQKLYNQLQTQTATSGLVELDTKFTVAMSPKSQTYLTKTSAFNVNVMDILKKNFPGMTIKVAPEYVTGSGELMQMIVDSFEGQKTATTAFTEKLRAHPIEVKSSSFKQKKSQGTWGTIIFRPMFIAQMIGI